MKSPQFPSHLLLIALLLVLFFGFSERAVSKEVGSTFLHIGGLTQWSQQQRTSKVLTHRWWTELGFGYTPFEFLSIGLVYAIDQSRETTSGFSLSSDNYESRDYRTSIGPQLHVWLEPLFLSATYFLDSKLTSELTTDGLSPSKYEGNGTSFEIGVIYPLSSLQFSLSLLYRTWKYSNRSQAGGSAAALNPPLEDSRIEPSLKAWWFF